MSRLVTCGFESGEMHQFDHHSGSSADADFYAEYDVTSYDPGGIFPSRIATSCNRYGYVGDRADAQFKFADISECYYRDYQYVLSDAYPSTLQHLMLFTDPSPIERFHIGNRNWDLSLWLTTTGAVELRRDHGSTPTLLAVSADAVVPLRTWYRFEVWFKMANSGGRVIIRIDDSDIIDFTGDTQGAENTSGVFSIVGMGIQIVGLGGTVLVAHDDVALNDTTGSFNNSWPGEGEVTRLDVVGFLAGASNNLNGTPDATDRWLNVDDDDRSVSFETDYNYESVVGRYDLYELAGSLVGGTPKAIAIYYRVSYPGAASTFKAVWSVNGGAEQRSAALSPTVFPTFPPPDGVDGPQYRRVDLDADPSGAAWTLATALGLEAGFEVATAQEMRLTAMHIEVEGVSLCQSAGGWGWSPGSPRWHLFGGER